LFTHLGEAAQQAITATVANQPIAEVAQLLGNTVAVCRKSYVHPEVLALLSKTKTMPVPWKAAQPKRKAGLAASECRPWSALKAQRPAGPTTAAGCNGSEESIRCRREQSPGGRSAP